MVLFKKVVPRLLLLFAICFAVTPAAFAPAQAQNTDTNLKQDSQQPGLGQSRSPGGTGQSGLEEAIPIDAEKIDDWMEAMTMEYPVKPDSELAKIHAGDHIEATVVVNGGFYYVTDVKVVPKK